MMNIYSETNPYNACPGCGSLRTEPATKNFGKLIISNAIFCKDCGRVYYDGTTSDHHEKPVNK